MRKKSVAREFIKRTLLKFPRVALNYGDVARTLGLVAVILGLCMFLCIPWGSPAVGGGDAERQGVEALLFSGAFSILLGAVLIFLGRAIAMRDVRRKRRAVAAKAAVFVQTMEANVARIVKEAADETEPHRVKIAEARIAVAEKKLQSARAKVEEAKAAIEDVSYADIDPRNAPEDRRLFRKEAIVVVALSWILAIVLGALPYLFSGAQRVPGVSMSLGDAVFESASGLTTTGATVFGELENASTLPRTILFWRGFTHFLGGLGVMCFFVALIGQGMSGKTILKLEHSSSSAVPISKIRQFASCLFRIYVSLTGICFVAFLFCGMNVFDAIFHAFSVVALGGFSSHNASVAYFSLDPRTNGLAIECILIFFMVVAGTNYWLLYWVLARKPGRLFRDSEWRLYVSSLLLGIAIVTILGMRHGDFLHTSADYDPTAAELVTDGSDDPTTLNRLPATTHNSALPKSSWGSALRRATFQVVSLATGAGFATDRYELWNAASIVVLLYLMFVGGCVGSTAGGAKVYRVLLASKAWWHCFSESFSPNIVRVMRLDDENLDRDELRVCVTYLFTLTMLILMTAAVVLVVEQDAIWIARGESQVEKMWDVLLASVSMFSNVGPALGALGSFDNYGALSEGTKFIFAWAMLLGRLEIWTVLTLLSPKFWRSR